MPLTGITLGTTEIGINGTLGQFRAGTALPPTIKPVGFQPRSLAFVADDGGRRRRGQHSSCIDECNRVQPLQATLDPLIVTAKSAVGSVLATVGTLVAIHVNVQPDQPWPGTKPDDVTASAGEYKVSAVRVGLIGDASLLSLSIGNSSAGPVSLRVP